MFTRCEWALLEAALHFPQIRELGGLEVRRHHLKLMHMIAVGDQLGKIAKIPPFVGFRQLFIQRGGKEIVEAPTGDSNAIR